MASLLEHLSIIAQMFYAIVYN